jgi:tetratricopeptide (TPR) repeat protein
MEEILMKTMLRVCLGVCLVGGTHGYGQFPVGNSNTSEFRGRVVDGGADSYAGLVIEISNLRDRTIREHVDVNADGLFWFRGLPEGDYEIKVLTQYGQELVSTIGSVGVFSTPLEIRLPGPKLARPPSGSVSIQQLDHPLSKPVRKLLESGQKLFDEKHYDDAAARFRTAAADDPQCAQAQADLGLALSKLEAWEGTVEAYRAASALDPKNSVLHSNLSVALVMTHHFDEAETESATALRLDRTNARAHYVMAGLLLRKEGRLGDAVSHLVAAEDYFPSAKAAVEKICSATRVAACPRN